MFVVAGAVLYLILLVGTTGYALLRGGICEQQAATRLLLAALASALVSMVSPSWDRPQYALMAVDTIFFVLLVPIAVRSRRFWPQWAAAAQLTATITHLIPIVETNVNRDIYATLQPAWAVVILAALFLGTMQERAERQASQSKIRR